jgi:hypothetical protein
MQFINLMIDILNFDLQLGFARLLQRWSSQGPVSFRWQIPRLLQGVVRSSTTARPRSLQESGHVGLTLLESLVEEQTAEVACLFN